MMDKVKAFQQKYKTKEEKANALKVMSNQQIDELIADCPNVQGKVWYASFKK